MVTTQEIAPIPVVAPFVRCYTYREFNTYGADVVKPWYASHELYLPFFFGDFLVKLVARTGKVIYGSYAESVGISTHYIGDMTFNGNYSFFSIQFKPNGFTKLFRLPSHEFTNNIICVDEFLGSPVKLLYEQLQNAMSIYEMAALTDNFLLSYIKKQHFVESKDVITYISESILKKAGFINVKQLACDANMSIRNFERHFSEQIGTSPKLFCRITRFNKALALKLQYPYIDWTSIAYQTGYFDQMHLIKDCKEFTGKNPFAFIKETPLLERDFSHRLKV